MCRVYTLGRAPTPKIRGSAPRPRAPPEFNFQLDLSGRHCRQKLVEPISRSSTWTGSVSRQVDSFVSLFTTRRRPKRVRMCSTVWKINGLASTIRYEELTIPRYSTLGPSVSKEFRVFSLQKRWIDSLLLFRLCELAVKLLKRSFEIQEILHSLFQNFCDWDWNARYVDDNVSLICDRFYKQPTVPSILLFLRPR